MMDASIGEGGVVNQMVGDLLAGSLVAESA
jgi:hypothetical protein